MRAFTLSLILLAPGLAHAAWLPASADLAAYSEGVVALGTQRLEDAEATFRRLLEGSPDCGMCRQGLGVAQLRQGRVEEAVVTLQAATVAAPDQPEVWSSLSAAAFAAQDLPRAREAALRAVAVDPGSIDGQAALQQVLLRMGDLELAQVSLDRARQDLPDPVVACFEVQLSQERGKAVAADRLEACRRAGTPDLVAGALSRANESSDQVGALAARLGMDPVVLVAQALDREQAGDLRQASALLDRVLAGWPQRADARAMRARLRRAQGDRAGAEADLEALLMSGSWVDVHRSGATSGILRQSDAVRLQSTVAEGAAALVELHLDAGDLPGAQARWTAVSGLPAHPALFAIGARLALKQGDPALAWSRVNEGMERFPNDSALLSVAGGLAASDPAGLGPERRAALAASPHWRDHLNLAAVLRKEGDVAGCTTQAGRALSGAAPEEGDAVVLLLHGCAVDGGDRQGADAALARLKDVGQLRPGTRYNHALLHLNAQDSAAAARVLGRLPEELAAVSKADDPVLRAMLALGLRVAAAQADWGRGEALSRLPAAPLDDRLWFVGAMLDAGLVRAAAGLLPADCDSLEPPFSGRCAVLKARSGAL